MLAMTCYDDPCMVLFNSYYPVHFVLTVPPTLIDSLLQGETPVRQMLMATVQLIAAHCTAQSLASTADSH